MNIPVEYIEIKEDLTIQESGEEIENILIRLCKEEDPMRRFDLAQELMQEFRKFISL